METKKLIEQIKELPLEDKMLLIEQTLKLIREKDLKDKMIKAVQELQEDYKSNKELTSFTDIDFDTFYESR